MFRSSARRSLVLRADDPAARFPKVLDQADVPEHQARLCGHIARELLLRRVHRVVGRHGNGERTEQLALVPHFECNVVTEVWELVRPGRHVSGLRRIGWPGCIRPHLVADAQPDPSLPRAGRLTEELCHPREDVLR